MNTVLVIDDSLVDRQILGAYLQEAGLGFLSAKSAQEAMETLSDRQPNLIVLDIVMADKSGFEVCRQLKAEANTQSIPIVICSLKSSDADKLWGEMVGADAYLSKPVDREKFIQTVRKLIIR